MDLEELQAKVSACVKDMIAAHRAGLKVSAADAIYKHFGLDEVSGWDTPQSITVFVAVRNEFNVAVAKLNAKKRGS